MNHDTNLFMYFWHAGMVVKAVMLLLLGASLYAWSIIFDRTLTLKRAIKKGRQFRQRMYESRSLQNLHQQSCQQQNPSAAASVFIAGYHTYLQAAQRGHDTANVVEQVQRQMHIVSQHQLDALSTRIDALATIGSVSPYLGLFGTVWGIMGSFHALGQAQSATLSMVAPGIAEALVATAMGLFAAIPAVVAYNRFRLQCEKLQNQMDDIESILIASIESAAGTPANPTHTPTQPEQPRQAERPTFDPDAGWT